MNKSRIRIFISTYVDYVNTSRFPVGWFLYMTSDKRYIDRYNIKIIYR